jgi:hypothetical protein
MSMRVVPVTLCVTRLRCTLGPMSMVVVVVVVVVAVIVLFHSLHITLVVQMSAYATGSGIKHAPTGP